MKTVFFDFDGVLTTHHDAMNSTCETISKKFSIDVEKVIQAYKKANISKLHTGQETVEEFFKRFFQELELDKLHNREEIYEGTPMDIRMIDIAKKIKENGFTVGLITDNNIERVNFLIEKHNLRFFDPIFVSETEKLTKDTPEVFKKILTKFKDSIFIDNKQKNCDNASEAGMIGLYFNDKERDYNKLEIELREAGVKI